MLNRLSFLTKYGSSRLMRETSKRFFATQNFKFPKIGDSVENATLISYLKEVGEYIEEDEDLIIVESHKGEVKIKSTLAGMVSSHLVEIEEDIDVGQDIIEIDVDAPRPEKTVAKSQTAKPVEKQVEKTVVKPVEKAQPSKAQVVQQMGAPPVQGNFIIVKLLSSLFLKFLNFLQYLYKN